jgi:hypothetical protein
MTALDIVVRVGCWLPLRWNLGFSHHIWPYQCCFTPGVALHELSVHFTRARCRTTAKVGFCLDGDFKPLVYLETVTLLKSILGWIQTKAMMISPFPFAPSHDVLGN